jgi:cellulose synthase/poly-beta-1,6-N-acetylglucosamine synthase-like glycosyltransferase
VTRVAYPRRPPASADPGLRPAPGTDPGAVRLRPTPGSQRNQARRPDDTLELDDLWRIGTADDEWRGRPHQRSRRARARAQNYPHSRVGHHRVGSAGFDADTDLPAGYDQGTQAFKVLAVSVVVLLLAATALVAAELTKDPALALYWVFNAAMISVCLVAFLNERRFSNFPVARGRTIAIVPAYNEPPRKLEACVRSLIAQTVTIDMIVVVDDGSARLIEPFYHPRVLWIRQDNRGKRGAHATALRQFRPSDVQFVLTVDSDSTPYPDALEHMLRAMSRRKVQAVTGWLHVRNYDDSLIARAADINIGMSCVMMRASRSMLGALETTSGALSLYRSAILYDNLAEYEVECGTGDDRWLTMRALLRGEVIGVNQARVETDMPATLHGTFRQRLRWARSWWWMLPFAYARLGWRPLVSPTIGLIQLLAAPAILVWGIVALSLGYRAQLAHPETALLFAAAYLVVKYTVAALYLAGRQGMPTRQKLLSLFFATPVAMLLSLFMLMPLRFYALARLRDTRWHTRQVKANA